MGKSVPKNMDGVQSLRQLASGLENELEVMHGHCERLKKVYHEVEGQVAHKEEIEELVDEILRINSQCATPIATLVSKTRTLARKLEIFVQGKLGSGS